METTSEKNAVVTFHNANLHLYEFESIILLYCSQKITDIDKTSLLHASIAKSVYAS